MDCCIPAITPLTGGMGTNVLPRCAVYGSSSFCAEFSTSVEDTVMVGKFVKSPSTGTSANTVLSMVTSR